MVEVDVAVRTTPVENIDAKGTLANIAATELAQAVSAADSVAVETDFQLKDQE